MRSWIWLGTFAVTLACGSGNQSGSRRLQPTNGADTGAPDNAVSVTKGEAPSTDSVLLSMPTAQAPVDSGIVEPGCEVGKFCRPTTPDPENCGTLTLGQEIERKKVPGNLLLVFDQSASMSEDWGMSGMTKLKAAQTAIRNAVEGLKDEMTVGALFFPTTACFDLGALGGQSDGGQLGGGVIMTNGMITGIMTTSQTVEPINGATQIPFQPAPMFLPLWDAHWQMANVGTGLGTPMQEAFDRASDAIASAQLTGDLAVVAVTDGAPNCFPSDQSSKLETNRASTWLAERGVKTYVVGLPGAAGVQLLNDVAVQGGTMEYILPDDPKVLEDRLRTLIQETTKTVFDSCSIKLTPAADPADKLLMIVKEADNPTLEQSVPHELTPTAGWTITPDGVSVEITGDLCSDAKGGRFISITFKYPCKEGEPIPPLSPS